MTGKNNPYSHPYHISIHIPIPRTPTLQPPPSRHPYLSHKDADNQTSPYYELEYHTPYLTSICQQKITPESPSYTYSTIPNQNHQPTSSHPPTGVSHIQPLAEYRSLTPSAPNIPSSDFIYRAAPGVRPGIYTALPTTPSTRCHTTCR